VPVRKGGLAAWSIRHPVSTIMLTLTVVVLGVFALGRLAVDLLPQIIYPQIRVRVLESGVAASIMEDKITRQLEEQLAITEDATGVESTTTEGQSEVSLQFDYGADIDTALRDASTRLDRAKRFLPTTIDPPVIFKSDPSQIPVIEFVVNSTLRGPVEMRTWTDDHFSKQFIGLPGVASVEVGGGLEREIHVLPDQRRLAGLGLSVANVIDAIKRGNEDAPGGRVRMLDQEIGSRTAGRVNSVAALAALPVRLPNGESISLSEVAAVSDSHQEERVRVRLDGVQGVKMSVQKQPNANTVEAVDHVLARLGWMRVNGLVPADIEVIPVSNQSIYIRQSLNNAATAAVMGAVLAMLVVYLFLGDIRGTLVIGTAIPISIMVTFVLMSLGGLTLNVISLGGLALGVGMLIDNTIIMLENIARHKSDVKPKRGARGMGEAQIESAVNAAGEINSAIVASTTTSLVAVLPFLFIGGLTGLLFRELIFTISAAILASLVVAITLVPTLAARISGTRGGRMHHAVHRMMTRLQDWYVQGIGRVLRRPGVTVLAAVVLLAFVLGVIFDPRKQEFLPPMDDGRIVVRVFTDPGTSLASMDESVRMLEGLARNQGDVEDIYTTVGGSVFGRTGRETPNRSTIIVQLVPVHKRRISSTQWVNNFQRATAQARVAGIKVRARPPHIRGLRTSSSDEEVSLRVKGTDLNQLAAIGEEIVQRLRGVRGIRNLTQSLEEVRQEFAVQIDRGRASQLGIDVADIGQALRIALEGVVVSDFLDGNRSYDIRVRLPEGEFDSPTALERILLFGELRDRPAVYLRDVATIDLVPAPATIQRDNQNRIVEITASPTGDLALGEIMDQIHTALKDYRLPLGHHLYSSGTEKTLQEGRNLSLMLLGLALFLVFVVMSVQYESLRNPTVIMLGVPFAVIGVFTGLKLIGLPVSMPVWLGLIMLSGIVVNNAIVLVEYIEILREQGREIREAIIEAGRLRLRPILMTTLTTVVGMAPLALGLGEGAEMLQPLAVTVVTGLSFSLLVSLLLVPCIYILMRQSPLKVRRTGDSYG
jgi:CzcA family heavy metal efflux pump